MFFNTQNYNLKHGHDCYTDRTNVLKVNQYPVVVVVVARLIKYNIKSELAKGVKAISYQNLIQ